MTEYVIHVEDAKTLYYHSNFPFALEEYLQNPVVRCKDCRFKANDGYRCRRTSHEFAVEPMGFCKWGKVR